jgi:hypothetical protein
MKFQKDAARTSEIAEATSLGGGGGGRGMDMKLQLGSAMLCAQLGAVTNQKKRRQAETVGGLLNSAQQEKKDCIELLKLFDKHTEEWDEAMDYYKKAKSEVRKFMDQLSSLATLNDGERTTGEEITDDFVESLRNRPAMATLHQPSHPSQASGRASQMVDLQALENGPASQVVDPEALNCTDACTRNACQDKEGSDMKSDGSEMKLDYDHDAAPDDEYYFIPQTATAATVVPTDTPAGPSVDDEINDGFPYCGAGKHCDMPNKRLNARCYDWKNDPKHRCKKCGHVLHCGLCGSGEGQELTCHKCKLDK